jgi:hypothetical protein
MDCVRGFGDYGELAIYHVEAFAQFILIFNTRIEPLQVRTIP